ncbi:MAG: hypothetical protein M9928_04740 [Anaerolineae bacterium]|nr:hypothetical protein [Anaerolineae bacterium]MCO5196389.1 hypothetical protein [Anaerolineae bacterium]MCO5204311.1 hypothetical protein [Anaerolineae bacterium]
MGVTEILALSSIIIAFLSVVITYSLFRLSMRQVSGDVIHRIIDRFEEPEMRDLRRMIYALDRDDFATWDKGLIDNVDKWGAELDIISTLLAQEENIKPFFMLYGDVFFRSIYQIAPYGVFQRTQRGNQFWLPMEIFGERMLKVWKKTARRGEYSKVIGVPGSSSVSLSLETFVNDKNCHTFLRKRK